MKRFNLTNRRLRKINWALAAVIIVMNGYIVLAPLWPQIDLWARKHQAAATAGLPYKTNLDTTKNSRRTGPPKDNRLVIPKLALNQHLWQGTSPYTVNKGVWLKPYTSTPPQGSNTVMVAHRFTYSGPATFYSLDKVSVGDKILVYWQQKEYDYTVEETKVVPPTAIYVENPTSQSELTLYTCTPLWSAKNRLVVVAKLDQGSRQ